MRTLWRGPRILRRSRPAQLSACGPSAIQSSARARIRPLTRRVARSIVSLILCARLAPRPARPQRIRCIIGRITMSVSPFAPDDVLFGDVPARSSRYSLWSRPPRRPSCPRRVPHAASSRACSSAAAASRSPRLALHNKIVSLGARPHAAGSAARCALPAQFARATRVRARHHCCSTAAPSWQPPPTATRSS